MKRGWPQTRTILWAVGISALVSLVAYVGYTANHADQSATDAKKEVRVLTASPCKAAIHDPKKLPACRKSFHAAVKLIGPSVACQLVKKGTSWLLVNGERVGGNAQLECVPPAKSKPSATPTQHPGEVDIAGGNSSPHGRTGPPRGGHGGHHEATPTPATTPTTSAPPAAPTEAPGNSGGHGPNGEGGQGEAKGQNRAVEVELAPEVLPELCVGNVAGVNCKH